MFSEWEWRNAYNRKFHSGWPMVHWAQGFVLCEHVSMVAILDSVFSLLCFQMFEDIAVVFKMSLWYGKWHIDISSKDDCIAWLSNIACSMAWPTEELQKRIACIWRNCKFYRNWVMLSTSVASKHCLSLTLNSKLNSCTFEISGITFGREMLSKCHFR